MWCGSSAVVSFGTANYIQALGGFTSTDGYCGIMESGTVSVPTTIISTTTAAGYIFDFPASSGFTITTPSGCDLGFAVVNRFCDTATCTPDAVNVASSSFSSFGGTSFGGYCRSCTNNNVNQAYAFFYVLKIDGSTLPTCTSFTVTPYNIYSGVPCTSCPGGSYPGGTNGDTTGCMAPPPPSFAPTPQPSRQPTPQPSAAPTVQPTPQPSQQPTPEPTPQPTPVPSFAPSAAPTAAPSSSPDPNATASQGAASTSNNTGAIVGAVVGVLVVGGAGYYFYNQKQALAKQAAEKSTAGLDTSNKI